MRTMAAMENAAAASALSRCLPRIGVAVQTHCRRWHACGAAMVRQVSGQLKLAETSRSVLGQLQPADRRNVEVTTSSFACPTLPQLLLHAWMQLRAVRCTACPAQSSLCSIWIFVSVYLFSLNGGQLFCYYSIGYWKLQRQLRQLAEWAQRPLMRDLRTFGTV